jgi:hypothetical protein
MKMSCSIHRRTKISCLLSYIFLKVFVPGVHHVLNEVNVEDDAAAANKKVRANLGSIT